MKKADELRREIEELRDRLSRLNEASLRITEDFDLDTALQGDSTFLPLIAQSGGGWGGDRIGRLPDVQREELGPLPHNAEL